MRTALPLLLLAVALICLILYRHPVGAAGECTVSAEAAAIDAEEATFLSIINNYRAQNGLAALALSSALNRASTWMSQDLGAHNSFSHTDSLGRSPYQRAIDCGYPYGAGENLVAGGIVDDAQTAFNLWKDSPGHNANMLGASYRAIGIGRHFTSGSQYGWYWTTNFGTVAESSATATPTRTPTRTPTPTVPPTLTPVPTPTPVCPYARGWSLVVAGSASLKQPCVQVIYGWIPDDRWERWFRQQPAWLNTFQLAVPGRAYWVFVQ